MVEPGQPQGKFAFQPRDSKGATSVHFLFIGTVGCMVRGQDFNVPSATPSSRRLGLPLSAEAGSF